SEAGLEVTGAKTDDAGRVEVVQYLAFPSHKAAARGGAAGEGGANRLQAVLGEARLEEDVVADMAGEASSSGVLPGEQARVAALAPGSPCRTDSRIEERFEADGVVIVEQGKE